MIAYEIITGDLVSQNVGAPATPNVITGIIVETGRNKDPSITSPTYGKLQTYAIVFWPHSSRFTRWPLAEIRRKMAVGLWWLECRPEQNA